MKLNLLQSALNRMKELCDNAILSQSAVLTGGQRKHYDNGNIAMTGLVRGEHHILPIHEAVKHSISEELGAYQHLVYPELGEIDAPIKNNELKIPSLKPKEQDITVILTDEDRINRDGEQLYWKSIDDTVVAEKALTVGVRSQLRSLGKNINTLTERSGAESILQRWDGMERSVKGELYIVASPEYSTEKAKRNRCEWNVHFLVEDYIIDALKLCSRPTYDDEYDWHDHVRYERYALVVVDFSQDPPRFYQNLEEMYEAGVVRRGFYDEHHEEYDSKLSPVDFAKDLVTAHLLQWDLPYPQPDVQ